MRYPSVLSPLRVGKFLFKNRIIIPPTRIISIDSNASVPTDESMEFWASRAKTGAGMVTVNGLTPIPEIQQRWDLNVMQTRNRIETMVDRMHYYGALASVEILSTLFDGYVVSEGVYGFLGTSGKEMPVAEIRRYQERIGEYAAKLKKLGFDGILIHTGHDTPLAQFLSPAKNKRIDEYGGSFENRTRFIRELLSTVKQAVGNDMFIEARISGSEYMPGGVDLEEGMRIGEAISPYLDILQVSAGMHNPDWMTYTHPSGFRPPLPNVHLARAFRESGLIQCKITTMGAIRNLQDADDLIASGTADFTAIARALIADPDMIHKCADGRIEDVVPCIQCMRCHDSGLYEGHFQCSVNPRLALAYWIDGMIEPSGGSRKVAVVGGGPAGMRAALTAAERGHEVTLYEMSNELGGLMRYAEHVSFKYPHARYLRYLIDQIAKSDVVVKLNTRATPQHIKNEGYDAVISAVGSEPIVPDIPGVEHAITAIEAHNAKKSLGEKIVIIGGGQVGIELALHLSLLGKKPTVLEMQREIAPDASKTQRDELLVELRKSEVKVLTLAACKAIESNKVLFEHDGVAKTLETDRTILAVGMKSRVAENDSFLGLTDNFRQAGDCIAPRILEYATKEGYYAALGI